MPVPRSVHESLKTSHKNLKRKYEQLVSEQAAGQRADQATAATITRLTTENGALRRILAAHIRSLEREGWVQTAGVLRDQLADAGLDLTAELASGWTPGEGALPATRTYTASESRLLADLHRRNQACGSLETQLLQEQSINEALARQMYDAAAPVEGGAA
jgi:hypothetical protein